MTKEVNFDFIDGNELMNKQCNRGVYKGTKGDVARRAREAEENQKLQK